MKKKILFSALVLPLSCFIQTFSVYALTDEEQLGKNMFEDTNFSITGTQSCMSCHDPDSGFADPTNSQDPETFFVSTSADGQFTGNRNAPTAAYAGYSPILHKKESQWHGGLFWDGRADGTVTGDPLADQAQGPPTNPVEMQMPDKTAVVDAVRSSDYSDLFLAVYGEGSLDNDEEAYTLISVAIAAYERSPEVQKFNSRFDSQNLTPEEQRGEKLFRDNCTVCHAMGRRSGPQPLFTNYGYANIGIPANPNLDLGGPDLGLGAIVDNEKENGKFKVPTLRNVDKTAPYGHNGYFSELEDIVSYHNFRDTDTWPPPEYEDNLSNKVGDLRLNTAEIEALVAFLRSLNDE